VTVVKRRKPVPWMMNTVSPSPKGWLTHSSGVVPAWWAAHGGGDATGPGMVVPAVLVAEPPGVAVSLAAILGLSPAARAPDPCTSAPIQMPPPSRSAAATTRAQIGRRTRAGGRGPGSASGVRRRRLRARLVDCPCRASWPLSE
jgi:hypothetical protein